MSTQPTDDEIDALAKSYLTAHAQFIGAGDVWFEGEIAFARAVLAKWGTPVVVKWAPEEIADDERGIRWVTNEGIHGRPTDHDVREYLKLTPTAHGCHCDECKQFYTTPQPVREPAGWLYDWISDEGELVRDWFTTDYDEAHSEANQAHNIRALEYRGTSPQPVREPLNIVELMRVVMKADEESQDTRGTTNWAAHIGKSVQNAVLGITGGQHGTDA